MSSLVLAAATFLALHVVVSGTRLRDGIVGAIGDGLYRGLFALASLATIVWMARAYAAAPGLPGRRRGRCIGSLCCWACRPPCSSPSVSPRRTQRPPAPRASSPRACPCAASCGSRAPVFGGVAIWALAHLLVNGDAASLVLFGTLLALALLGPRLIDAKRARAYGQRWAAFAAPTSVLPFAAIAAGRNRVMVSEIATWRPARRRRLRGAPRRTPLADRHAGPAAIVREITACDRLVCTALTGMA